MHLVWRNALCTLAAAEADGLDEGLIDITKPAVDTQFLLYPTSLSINLKVKPQYRSYSFSNSRVDGRDSKDHRKCNTHFSQFIQTI